jgi:hypothetical protein
VPEPSAFEVEMAIEKLKGHKSLGTDHIPAELIRTEVTTICSEIHKLLNSILNKDELPEEWPPVKVNSVCRRNYCGSSVWIAKQQVK